MKRALMTLVLASSYAGTALAFVRTTDATTGACLFWTSRELPWTLNEKGSDDPPFGTLPPVQAALERSFQTWQDVDCSDLTFRFAGTTPRTDIGFDPGSADNINLLIWRETACLDVVPEDNPCLQDGTCSDSFDCWDHATGVIALTTTSYNRNNGEIVDADIEFNGSPDSSGRSFRFTATVSDRPICPRNAAVDAVCVSTDIQNTATHEIGHFFGLAHSPLESATMFASAAVGETSKRTLSQDDIDGICDIYPTGQRALQCVGSPNASVGNGSGADSGGCDCSQGDAAGVMLLASLLLRWRRRTPLPAKAQERRE